MKITIINGSPKLKKSNSELLIRYLKRKLEAHEVAVYNISRKRQYEEALKSEECTVLVFVFPLYVDSIPSTLLEFLVALEEQGISAKTRVYCCINNGFFEGGQNKIAAQQMKLWCQKAGGTWGQAVGVGAGEMMPFLRIFPLWSRGMSRFSKNILNLTSAEDFYFSPLFPRFLWRFFASLFFWFPKAVRNGLKPWELKKKE